TLLTVAPHLIIRLRAQPSPPPVQAEAPPVEKITATNVNLRAGPDSKAPRIGLVERNSRVRILAFSDDRQWCKIEVLQHGHDRGNISVTKRGWVYAKAIS